VAKTYRTIRFSFNTTTLEIDVPLRNESVTREELSTIRQTINGSRYRFVTGSSRVFTYSFAFVDESIFNFFNTAYNMNLGGSVLMSRELDTGWETVQVIIEQPQWADDTLGTDEKVYGNLTVRVVTA
jgi:hypothetical protein